jgi:hypothetical protein
MVMIRSSWRVLVFIAVSCFAMDTAAKPISEATWQALTNAAALTRHKRLSEACGWTMAYRHQSGAAFAVDFRDRPGQQRVEFLAYSPSGEKASIATVTITNGVWYVKSAGRKPTKYRPYEAPLFYGFCYDLLNVCKLRYVDEQRLTGISGVELLTETNGVVEIAVKSGPAVEAYIAPIRQMLAKVRAMGEFKQRKETEELLKRLLDEGWRFKVDKASGIVLEARGGDWKAEFSDFRWTKDAPDPLDGEWLDRTRQIQNLNSDHIAMAFYRLPLTNHKDLDGYFLNLHTGEYRRIPARAGLNSPGCFLADRSKVITHVFDLANGVYHPFVIDLKSGENTRFGPAELHQPMSMTFGGSLSRDGKAVALVFLPSLGDFEKKRICAVDVGSNACRMVGPEDDYTDALWFSNAKELVVERMIPESDPNAYVRHEVGVLDASGKYHALGQGQEPVVLKDDRVIYFRAMDKRWVIVDKTGRHAKALANLDENFRGPTLTADGNFLLIMKFGEPPLITPFSFDLHSKKLTELRWPEGAWAKPILSR